MDSLLILVSSPTSHNYFLGNPTISFFPPALHMNHIVYSSWWQSRMTRLHWQEKLPEIIRLTCHICKAKKTYAQTTPWFIITNYLFLFSFFFKSTFKTTIGCISKRCLCRNFLHVSRPRIKPWKGKGVCRTQIPSMQDSEGSRFPLLFPCLPPPSVHLPVSI